MLTHWSEARRTAFTAASALPPEIVPLDRAVGRLLTASVTALSDVSHYASSAMDGWAVAGDAPWQLVDSANLEPGQATLVVTGGVIPGGAGGVLRSENGLVEGWMLAPNDRARADEPRAGEHIRPAGEEAVAGEVVVTAGTVLNPAHVAVAAGCGNDEMTVARLPRVGLVLTGNEVIEAGIPAPGQVRDSFGVQFPALMAMLGGCVIRSSRVPDDLESLVAALGPKASAVDVIITTGGTGHSSVDHLHAALEQLGARLLVDGVAMRPGGPTLLAQLPDGPFLIGLPGNPLAAMMGVLTLVQPLLAALQGAPEPNLGSVVLAHDVPGARGGTRLVPFTLDRGLAVATRWQGAGMMRGLADAAGVLICPAEGASARDTLETIELPWMPVARSQSAGAALRP
ncbi:MAG: molybdopterin molybdotransferase MoeA [Microbacteriaceae bacterium]|nr:molybdopterin molybdotransferase MoeA [Microbacteriaceae bacterium]